MAKDRMLVPAQPVDENAPKFAGDVTVELGDERNREFIWSPTGEKLRGTWQRANLLPAEHTELTSALPDVIPGIRIQIDGRNRRLRIYDPLTQPDAAGAVQEINAAMKSFVLGTFGSVGGLPTVELAEGVTDTQIKTWLYFAARMVQGVPVTKEFGKKPTGGPKARVVAGTLPTFEEISKLRGKTQIGQQDSGHGKNYIEDGVEE